MKKDSKGMQIIAAITLISVLPVLAVYLPFSIHLQNFWGIPLGTSGMQVIFANWDGPNYVYNAITNYSLSAIEAKPFLHQASYYPAHFPGLSWLIYVSALVFGYFWGPILLQLVAGILLNLGFYFFIKSKSKHALWLTFAFTIFPPRYLVVRSVIGADVWITLFVILTFLLWENKRYLPAGLTSFFAVIFKFQAIVLPLSLFLTFCIDSYKSKKINLKQLIAVIIGLSGYLAVSLYYQSTTGNFNAYFAAQKLVGMAASVPFAMFNYSQKWVGTGWMETAALYFVAMFVMIFKLMQEKKYTYAIFCTAYTLMLTLIPQVDIMRLAMPLTPIFFYAFSDVLSSKSMKWGLVASIPAIYLFTINFLVKNQAPINDWSLFR